MPYIDKIQVDGVDYDLEVPQIYDDQERVIGTWFGKPIYRKVITLTKAEYDNLETFSNRKLYPINSFNIDTGLRGDVILTYTDNNIYTTKNYSMHSIATNSTYDAGIHNLNSDGIVLVVGTSLLALTDLTIHMVIEYTKTTDIVE